MFVPDTNEIDKVIENALENIFFITGAEKVQLNRLVPILKYHLKKNDFVIRYNSRIRNVHFYLKKMYGSISQFIRNKTNYIIDTENGNEYLYPVAVNLLNAIKQ
jgi:hypothetical protein